MRYLFEDFVLDTGTRELRRANAPVAVEPLVFDLLAYVVEDAEHYFDGLRKAGLPER